MPAELPVSSPYPPCPPSLAVVLPTVDREDALRHVIGQVLDQAPSDAEVLVVDQSDADLRDRNAAWCRGRHDPRLRHLARQVRGLPAARNAALAATRAPLVLFLDDDVHLHPGCIAAHLAAYRDPTVGGVVGRIHERRLRPNAGRTTNRVGMGGRIRTRLDGADSVPIETLKGANMSLRRCAIEQAGGFDPGFAGSALLEDADLSVRVRDCGWRLVYEPDAALDHLHLPTGGVRADGAHADWWRFHNTARFVRKHRGWVGLAPLLVTFGAIAVRRALTDPTGAASCLGALHRGWWAPQGADRIR